MQTVIESHTGNRARVSPGFTLVELCIAVAVLGLVAAGTYSLVDYANRQTASALARQDMIVETEKLFKLLQWDVASVASLSLKISDGATLLEMNQLLGPKMARIAYVFEKPRLFRKVWIDKQLRDVRIAARGLDTIEVEKKDRILPSGRTTALDETQLLVRTVFSARIHGMKKPLTHEQGTVITMRAAAGNALDPNWRDVGKIGGVFQTYNSLIDSLQADADKWLEDVSTDIKQVGNEANADLANAKNSFGSVQDSINSIKNGLKKVSQAKIDLASAVATINNSFDGLSADALESDWYQAGQWFKDKDTAMEDMKTAFRGMTSPEKMSWDKMKEAANGYKIPDDYKQLFDSKNEAFKNLDQLNKTESELNKTLSELQNSSPGETSDNGATNLTEAALKGGS